MGAHSRPISDLPGQSAGEIPPIPDWVTEEEQAEMDARAEARESRRAWFLTILEFFALAAIAIVVTVVIKTFLVQAFYVPSGSMETTLNKGDRILVNRMAAKPEDIKRGDIIVFSDPDHWLGASAMPHSRPWYDIGSKVLETVGVLPADSGEHLVKRVIGLGGDTVECCTAEGLLKVNGTPVNERYLDPGVAPSEIQFSVKVPKGQLWVMGDNRSNSRDSRQHYLETGNGFVPTSRVVGRAWSVFYPISAMHVLADGREVFANVPDPVDEPEGDAGQDTGTLGGIDGYDTGDYGVYDEELSDDVPVPAPQSLPQTSSE